MAEVLIFLCGAAVGAAGAVWGIKAKEKMAEKHKYSEYKSKTGLYEGVKRK